jgi:hypothetical protein
LLNTSVIPCERIRLGDEEIVPLHHVTESLPVGQRNVGKNALLLLVVVVVVVVLREERRLRVFENRVLRRVFGPRRDEVTGEWRKLHNEELDDLYSLPNIVRVVKSRRMRWAGHVARMGEERGRAQSVGGET